MSAVTKQLDKLPTFVLPLLFLIGMVIFGIVGPEAVSSDFFAAVITTLAYIMMGLGLNIVVGFAGLLDLGYVAFFAIGAFVMGWLGSAHFGDKNIHLGVSEITQKLDGIHVNFFVVIFLAAAFTAMWGALLGAPTLRLRGDYLAIVTLAFGEIVPRVFELSTNGIFGIGDTDWSNGRQGITPVDKPYLGVPGLDEITRIDIQPFYFIALGMATLVLFVNFRLRDSRLGRAWIAVREDEVAAAAMGVNLVRVKLWAYAIGAAIGGFAGAFLATFNNTVNVDQFEFGFSVFVLCMVIIGGMGNIGGVILGAIALTMFDRFGLSRLDSLPDKVGLDFDFSGVKFGLFGFFLISMMILRPEGFIPNRRRKIELHEGDATDDDTLYAVRN
jgi:branched-chain amino acid transport system permease protein